ncbi:MAG TPA: MFS transporter [Acidimicrobiales bacterium]|jgi:EmrB/QacA subfamily drug resistance transporter|nr:MFS transporter [Acidimicrobiales bacterium]
MAQVTLPLPSVISAPDIPGGWRTNRSILLAVILTAQLMVVLDATIVNVALPHIQHSLHFTSASLSWVLNAYVLTFGGLLLLGARSGDILGRRRTFLAGISLFSVSSLAGGFATASWMLLAARAAQGIGGALAAPAALALLTTIFPEGQERIRAIGLFTTVSAAGGATGLVAGGLLTEWASWRWVMFVNVPIGLAVIAVGSLVLTETPRRTGHFDLAGAITSTTGMTGVVLGLVEAGSSGWGAPITVISLFGGVALLAAFVRIEATAQDPVLPLRLLADPTRAAANAARGLGYAGMYGMVFFLTQFLQDVQHHSALVTGIGFLPTPTSVFLSSQVTSKVLTRHLPPKVLMLTGSTISAAGLLLLTQLHASTSYPQVLLSLILIGTGMGVSFVSLTTAGLAGVEPADAGVASGLINVMQQVGAALGLAVLVTVFDKVHKSGLTAATTAPARAALMHGLDVTFWVGAGFAVAALLTVALGVRREAVQVTAPAAAEIEVDLAA